MDSTTRVRIPSAGTVLALCLGAVAGCGGPADMTPIRGVVTLDGEPVPAGMVIYLPKEQNTGRQANGPIQTDGSFVMTSIKQGDGVKHADYFVIVRAEKPVERPKSREEAENQRIGPAERLVPDRYFFPESSGLSDQVSESHSGYVEFKLSSDPEAN